MKTKKLLMTNQELAAFCEQISMILKAGISPIEGISIMIEDIQDQVTKKVLQSIENSLDEGNNFYQSLVNANIFPEYMLEMIQIGEQAGRLEEVTLALSEHYKRDHELSSNIKSAISYPLVMIAMMLLVILVLITKVLPIFNQVFNQLGTSITGFSKFVMDMGKAVSQYSYIFMILIVLIVIIYIYFTRGPKSKERLANFTAKLFITKKASLKLATGYFTSGLAIALSSGLDIDESIHMANKLVTNPILKERIQTCMSLLADGKDFSKALIQAKIYSGIHARLIQIGFKTGAMDEVMKNIASKYDEEANQSISNLIAIIEPTLVAVLSIIVGLILLSVMLPLIGIMSSIG